MIRIYCAVRNDQMEAQRGGTMIRMLEQIRLSLAGAEYDTRLDQLEELIKVWDGHRRASRSYVEDYEDDDDSVARLE